MISLYILSLVVSNLVAHGDLDFGNHVRRRAVVYNVIRKSYVAVI